MVFREVYTDRQGRKQKTNRWRCYVPRPGGGRSKISGFPSKRDTERLQSNLEHLAARVGSGDPTPPDLERYILGLPDRIRARLRKIGLLPEVQVEHSRRLLDLLGAGQDPADLGEYGRYLVEVRGRTEAHARQQTRRARKILVDMCGFSVATDVSADKVAVARRSLLAEGLCAVTSDGYREAARALTRWLLRTGRLRVDPLVRPDGEQRAASESNRRALTTKETDRLIEITRQKGHVRGRLTSELRSLLYLLAVQTGLRKSELLALRTDHLRLDGSKPRIELPASETKNGKPARLFLPPETAARVRRLALPPQQRILPGGETRTEYPRVFRGPSPKSYRAAEVLRRDLTDAKIEDENAEGVVDFHSLRVTFITALARAGVPLAHAQKLARHCSPMLTANIYSRFGYDEDAEAIAKLPGAGGAAEEAG